MSRLMGIVEKFAQWEEIISGRQLSRTSSNQKASAGDYSGKKQVNTVKFGNNKGWKKEREPFKEREPKPHEFVAITMVFNLPLYKLIRATSREPWFVWPTNKLGTPEGQPADCKVVEKLLHPPDRYARNNKDKTPQDVFTATHKGLVEKGEKWMKDTASSCTIVAALIVTVVFAASITVPGGVSPNGLPIFLEDGVFNIFGVFDALALFSSTTSLLMFLSIFTARYGEHDFLYSLPGKLIFGLVTLFLSIICMMIAFGATLKIVFGDKKAWVVIPVVVLSSMPITLFALLQFPLLLDMIQSTYRPGLFRKRSNRILY
ncbi:hypothetical protein Vadar_018262 [Vaccinium darrowii]|uniref:Uncharacterized protein n=1 Tax=Vaccinium darrowii TaxID=229202 RepID=A0ACB7XSS4_9ERIC|nr:hypothetical protein Vadar_018262 [Vaccinium darrowii]